MGSTFWFAVPEAAQAATAVNEAEVEEQPEGPAVEEAQAVTPPPVDAPVHETVEDLPEVCSLCAQADLRL